jgi:antitoxin (DNA-binding transcriptional repressor) of toxin-antitoxin stability system
MPTERVGIRQFRENLSEYIDSTEPVAITRHGQTVGIYVPTKPKVTEEDRRAFHEAGERLRASWREQGLDPDQVVDEYFEELRKKKRGKKIA